MRTPKLLLLLVLPVLAIIVVVQTPFYKLRPFRRFMARDASYYSLVAQACDSVRQQHPVGTNRLVRLPGDDPSLPALLRQLRPGELRVYPNRLWIGIGNDRYSFAILWEPDPAHTNSWLLMSDYDGVIRTVYTAN